MWPLTLILWPTKGSTPPAWEPRFNRGEAMGEKHRGITERVEGEDWGPLERLVSVFVFPIVSLRVSQRCSLTLCVCVSVRASHSLHIHTVCWFSSLSDGAVDRMSLNLSIAASSHTASSTVCTLSVSRTHTHALTFTVHSTYWAAQK